MDLNIGRKIFGNSIALIAVAFVTKGSKLLSLVIIVRYFNQELFGQYALILALSELFRSVGDFGIEVTVVKWFASQGRNRKSILPNAAALRFITSTIAAVLLVATSVILGYSGTILWGIVLAGIGYYFGLGGSLLRAPFQAELSTKELVVPSLVVSVAYLAFVAIGAQLGLNVVLLVSLAVASDAFLFFYLLKQVGSRGLIQSGSLDKKQVNEIFRSSVPLGFLGIVVVGYARISSLIVAQLGGEVSLAHYTSASRITEVLLLGAGSFAASMLPVLSATMVPFGDKKTVPPSVFSYLRKMGFAMTFVSLILGLFSRQVIGFVFTDVYLDAAPSLAILGCSLVFASYNMLLTNMLFADEKQSFVFVISLVNLAISLFLSIILIPQWGFFGAAVATTTTEMINTTLQLIAVTRVCGLVLLDRRIAFPLLRFTGWTIVVLSISVVFENGLSASASGVLVGLYIFQLYFLKDFVVDDFVKLLKPRSQGELNQR